MPFDETEDRIEQLISLKIDGRLDGERKAELDALLARTPGAAEIEPSMRSMRQLLRSQPAPVPAAGLRDRVLERVAQARDRSGSVKQLRPWLVRLSAAAAILLGANVFVFQHVRAGDDFNRTPTIEDHLPKLDAKADAKEGTLLDFLAWHFLGRSK